MLPMEAALSISARLYLVDFADGSSLVVAAHRQHITHGCLELTFQHPGDGEPTTVLTVSLGHYTQVRQITPIQAADALGQGDTSATDLARTLIDGGKLPPLVLSAPARPAGPKPVPASTGSRAPSGPAIAAAIAEIPEKGTYLGKSASLGDLRLFRSKIDGGLYVRAMDQRVNADLRGVAPSELTLEAAERLLAKHIQRQANRAARRENYAEHYA